MSNGLDQMVSQAARDILGEQSKGVEDKISLAKDVIMNGSEYIGNCIRVFNLFIPLSKVYSYNIVSTEETDLYAAVDKSEFRNVEKDISYTVLGLFGGQTVPVCFGSKEQCFEFSNNLASKISKIQEII